MNRFLAALVDGLLLWVLTVLVNFGLPKVVSDLRLLAWLSFGLVFLIQVLYHVVYQHVAGQTLGKRLLKLKIVEGNGQKVTLGRLFIREVFGKYASSASFGLGFLWILWDKKRQGWHDKIADTVVVKV